MGLLGSIGGALKKVAGVAAPIAGGIFGGPVGAAIGSGLGGLLAGGGGQEGQNSQIRQLQQRSEADRAARLPFQKQFGEGIEGAKNISQQDLTGRLGGTTAAPTNLVGQQLGLGSGTGELAGQRLGQAGDLFGEARTGIGGAQGTLGQAGDLFKGSTEGLPEFGGVSAGTGEFSRGLNQQAQGQIGSGQLPGFQGVGAGTFDPSAQTRGLEGQAIGQVGQALGAPGVGASAQGQLQNIFEQSEDARKIGSRDIGRSAAAFGRVGSGVVNTELGNLEERIQRGQNQAFRGLAGDTAQAEAKQQLDRAGLGLGAAGQFQGRDLANAGFQQGLRGEARGERGQEFGQALAGGQFGLDRAGALQGLGQTQFGQDQSLRGEARGERGAGLDESFRRAQLGQDAGQGLLGVSAGQRGAAGQLGDLGSRFGDLAGQGQGLDLQRLESLRGERGFQAGQDQQQFGNRNQVFGQERGALGQDRQFELDRLRQVGNVGFGGQPISGGDLGVLGNLTDTQNSNIQQSQDLAQGFGDLFGGGGRPPLPPPNIAPPGPRRPLTDRNIFEGARLK